ncbi:MAG: hypothetical protein GY757_03610 [bacterium]|nr:hypothetical protein [bacterium]
MAEEMVEFVIDFKQMVKKNSAGESHIFRDAPCVVVIAAPKGYDQSRDDYVAAQNYMMLYGQTENIGSCIIGYAQYAHKKLAKYLNIQKDTQIYAVTIFGKPVYKYKKSLIHKEPTIAWK